VGVPPLAVTPDASGGVGVPPSAEPFIFTFGPSRAVIHDIGFMVAGTKGLGDDMPQQWQDKKEEFLTAVKDNAIEQENGFPELAGRARYLVRIWPSSLQEAEQWQAADIGLEPLVDIDSKHIVRDSIARWELLMGREVKAIIVDAMPYDKATQSGKNEQEQIRIIFKTEDPFGLAFMDEFQLIIVPAGGKRAFEDKMGQLFKEIRQNSPNLRKIKKCVPYFLGKGAISLVWPLGFKDQEAVDRILSEVPLISEKEAGSIFSGIKETQKKQRLAVIADAIRTDTDTKRQEISDYLEGLLATENEFVHYDPDQVAAFQKDLEDMTAEHIAETLGEELTVDNAKKKLADVFAAMKQKKNSLALVGNAVARYVYVMRGLVGRKDNEELKDGLTRLSQRVSLMEAATVPDAPGAHTMARMAPWLETVVGEVLHKAKSLSADKPDDKEAYESLIVWVTGAVALLVALSMVKGSGYSLSDSLADEILEGDTIRETEIWIMVQHFWNRYRDFMVSPEHMEQAPFALIAAELMADTVRDRATPPEGRSNVWYAETMVSARFGKPSPEFRIDLLQNKPGALENLLGVYVIFSNLTAKMTVDAEGAVGLSSQAPFLTPAMEQEFQGIMTRGLPAEARAESEKMLTNILTRTQQQIIDKSQELLRQSRELDQRYPLWGAGLMARLDFSADEVYPGYREDIEKLRAITGKEAAAGQAETPDVQTVAPDNGIYEKLSPRVAEVAITSFYTMPIKIHDESVKGLIECLGKMRKVLLAKKIWRHIREAAKKKEIPSLNPQAFEVAQQALRKLDGNGQIPAREYFEIQKNINRAVAEIGLYASLLDDAERDTANAGERQFIAMKKGSQHTIMADLWGYYRDFWDVYVPTLMKIQRDPHAVAGDDHVVIGLFDTTTNRYYAQMDRTGFFGDISSSDNIIFVSFTTMYELVDTLGPGWKVVLLPQQYAASISTEMVITREEALPQHVLAVSTGEPEPGTRTEKLRGVTGVDMPLGFELAPGVLVLDDTVCEVFSGVFTSPELVSDGKFVTSAFTVEIFRRALERIRQQVQGALLDYVVSLLNNPEALNDAYAGFKKMCCQRTQNLCKRSTIAGNAGNFRALVDNVFGDVFLQQLPPVDATYLSLRYTLDIAGKQPALFEIKDPVERTQRALDYLIAHTSSPYEVKILRRIRGSVDGISRTIREYMVRQYEKHFGPLPARKYQRPLPPHIVVSPNEIFCRAIMPVYGNTISRNPVLLKFGNAFNLDKDYFAVGLYNRAAERYYSASADTPGAFFNIDDASDTVKPESAEDLYYNWDGSWQILVVTDPRDTDPKKAGSIVLESTYKTVEPALAQTAIEAYYNRLVDVPHEEAAAICAVIKALEKRLRPFMKDIKAAARDNDIALNPSAMDECLTGLKKWTLSDNANAILPAHFEQFTHPEILIFRAFEEMGKYWYLLNDKVKPRDPRVAKISPLMTQFRKAKDAFSAGYELHSFKIPSDVDGTSYYVIGLYDGASGTYYASTSFEGCYADPSNYENSIMVHIKDLSEISLVLDAGWKIVFMPEEFLRSRKGDSGKREIANNDIRAIALKGTVPTRGEFRNVSGMDTPLGFELAPGIIMYDDKAFEVFVNILKELNVSSNPPGEYLTQTKILEKHDFKRGLELLKPKADGELLAYVDKLLGDDAQLDAAYKVFRTAQLQNAPVFPAREHIFGEPGPTAFLQSLMECAVINQLDKVDLGAWQYIWSRVIPRYPGLENIKDPIERMRDILQKALIVLNGPYEQSAIKRLLRKIDDIIVRIYPHMVRQYEKHFGPLASPSGEQPAEPEPPAPGGPGIGPLVTILIALFFLVTNVACMPSAGPV
ncbi:MAG: hypothetical protein PHS37_08075, partial [Candidatus Omnitrophica bacterium]|nr:hypothetical protein [Candidatus Omnitrophota bacterium]